jgi:hypothetical protein
MFGFALGLLALAPANAAPVNVGPAVCPVHRNAVSPKIIVQGGTPAIAGRARPGSDNPAALGPKQDDPGPPPAPDLHATKVGGMGDPAALGPKQDDPGPPPAPDLHATKVGGMGDPAALGPKQDDPGPPPAPDLHASVGSCQVQPGGSPR